jgi:hypothetical protein
MSPTPDPATLDDVLEAYLLAADGPDYPTLQHWMARYPAYAADLSACAAEWSRIAWLPPGAGTPAPDRLDAPLARGQAVVQAILDRQAATAPAAAAGARRAAPAWWDRRILLPLPAFAAGLGALAVLVLAAALWLISAWSSPPPPSPLVSYGGTIHAMSASSWIVDDEEVQMDAQTEIHGHPVVGAAVVCIGELRPPHYQLHAVAVWVQVATPPAAP